MKEILKIMRGMKQQWTILLLWVTPVLLAGCGGHGKEQTAVPAAGQVAPVVEVSVAMAREALDAAGDRVLVVPVSAIVSRQGSQQVFVAGSDGIVLLRWVSTGHTLNGHVEVLGGLEPGEPVVVSPSPELRDGTRITIVTHTQERAKEAQHQ